jgi:hypothetical protein
MPTGSYVRGDRVPRQLLCRPRRESRKLKVRPYRFGFRRAFGLAVDLRFAAAVFFAFLFA